MSAPFCTACGATVAAGTRFCVKCGQPVGQAAPPSATVVQTPLPPPPPPPSPLPTGGAAQFPAAQDPAGLYPPPPPAPKQGSGIGVWIGIFGVLLLIGGAGLWFYTTHGPGFHASSTTQAAAQPAPPEPAPAPPPAPSPTTDTPPPNPEQAKPEVVPPNPDLAAKDHPQARPKAPAVQATPASDPPPEPAPPPDPAPAPPPPKPVVRASSPTSGVLHANVEVALNGEVVFGSLPNGRLRFTYDHSAWMPTIHHEPNGTQTLVMRSLKAGIQKTCDVQWEVVQQ